MTAMADDGAAPPLQDEMRIAVAQLNSCAGDVAGNAAIARRTLEAAAEQEADLVILPQGFLAGAGIGALAMDPDLLRACDEALAALAPATRGGPALLIGAPQRFGATVQDGTVQDGPVQDGPVQDAMVLLADGRIATARHRVAQENDWYAPGPLPGPVPFREVRLGLVIGADLATADVSECLAETGAELLIAPAALPFRRSGQDARLSAAVARVVECGLPLLVVNAVGAQDEAIFDGGSFALDTDRRLAMHFPRFEERVRMTLWRRYESGWRCADAPAADSVEGEAAIYAALMLGVRDFVHKSGKARAAIAQDGPEADLLFMLAADALGPDRVSRAGGADETTLALGAATRSALFLGASGWGDLLPFGDVTDSELARLAAYRAQTRPHGTRAPDVSFTAPELDLAALDARDAAIAALPGRPAGALARELDLAPQVARAEGRRRRAPPALRLTDRPPVQAPLYPITHAFKTRS